MTFPTSTRLPEATKQSWTHRLLTMLPQGLLRSARNDRTRLVTVLALILVLVAFAPSTASAADPAVSGINVEAPERLTVGDRVRFVIKVEADRGTTVTLAPGGLHDVMSQTGRLEARTRNLDGDRVEITLTFEAAPFAPGDIQLPPIGLRYERPDGTQGDLFTPTTRLIVESVLPQSGTVDLRDLKPQAEIAASSSVLLEVLISLIVLFVIVVGLIVLRLRRRVPVALEAPVAADALSAEDRARLVLDEAAQQLAGGEYVAFYSTLSSAVRNYLTERFGFPAFALTTTEMQERMVGQGMDRWQARIVGGLLNQCDAVVFASYRPAPERADTDLTAAYEIVEMSRPAERQPAEAGVS